MSEKKDVSTIDLNVLVNNSIHASPSGTPKITIEIGPKYINYIDFVKNGLKIEKGEKEDVEEVVEARIVKLNPQNITDNSWFSIDSEEYEVKPIKITLLPNYINVFWTNTSK